MGILTATIVTRLLVGAACGAVISDICCAQVTPPPVATPPTQAAPAPVTEAPHFFHQADGSVLAKWIESGEVKSQRFAKGKPIELPRFATLLGEQLQLTPHKVDAATWKQPEKLLAISDVEGEYEFMAHFLRSSGVIDKAGHWSFGKGHLVCVGDMVDRGTQVTETLLLLLRLHQEAAKAGGHVHYVLGNHEVMMMGADVRYTAPKYKQAADLLGIPVQGLVGANTEIGRFLRTRHALVRVGDYLFVHAGISTQVANTKLGIVKLNQVIRSVLGVPPLQITDRFKRAISWGALGPLWYRGYFRQFAAGFGPQPPPEAMDKILETFQAKTIVVGHTQVARIGSMYGKRRVLAIDIPWTKVEMVRGILITGDKLDVVDVHGKRVPFEQK